MKIKALSVSTLVWLGLAQQLLPGVSKKFDRQFVYGQKAPLEIVGANQVRGMFNQIAVAILALAHHDFHLFASGDLLSGANQRRDVAGRIFGGKSNGSYPLHSPAGTDDAKFLVEAIRPFQLLKLRQHSWPVLGMYQLAVRSWIGVERVEGEFTDLFKCWAHVRYPHSLRVQNPEYFLDVVRHLAESLLRFLQSGVLPIQFVICRPHFVGTEEVERFWHKKGRAAAYPSRQRHFCYLSLQLTTAEVNRLERTN
jgi:hypothetical protein